MASAYLNRTPSSAGNRKTWTYSAWFKIGNVSTGAKRLFTSYDGSTVSNQSTISLGGGGTDHTMQIYNAPSGSATINLITNRLFRDCNAWYHIVVAVDTTQSTGSNRVKLYINGVQELLFPQKLMVVRMRIFLSTLQIYILLEEDKIIHNILMVKWLMSILLMDYN